MFPCPGGIPIAADGSILIEARYQMRPNAETIRVLWICGLPREVQQEVLEGVDHGAYAAWSWIMGHLPPPEEGIELHIACRTARSTVARHFSYRGAHFHLVPVKARARVFCLFQFDWLYFRQVMAKVRPHVVHGWGTEDGYGLTALRLSPSHHVVEVQGNLTAYGKRIKMSWLTTLAAVSERMALARAKCVVAENDYSLGAALPLIRTSNLHTIEHPIRDEFLRAPPATGEGNQILFLGAVEARKGIDDALCAFRDGAPAHWQMCVVGGGSPAATAELQRFLRDHELTGRVQHRPQLTAAEIVTVMQQSCVLLLPSHIDTGPTALKEAMAMGLWPVCYDNSGPRYYVNRFGWGTVAKDLELADLTHQLASVLTARPWLSADLRGKIARSIRPHFDRNRIWKELIAVYRQMRPPPAAS